MTELTSLQDWEACLAVSEQRPVLVFKHSTRCPISATARQGLADYLCHAGARAPSSYEVLVIESRAVSDAIARTLAVEHASPQLFLVRNRQALWMASHYGINRDTIGNAAAQYTA